MVAVHDQSFVGSRVTGLCGFMSKGFLLSFALKGSVRETLRFGQYWKFFLYLPCGVIDFPKILAEHSRMIFSCRINAVMAEVLTRYGSFGHRDRCPVLDWGMRVDGIRISPDDNGADRLS